MEILLNPSAFSGEHDMRGLCRLYNEVKVNVQSVKAIGVEQDSYGTMLTSCVADETTPLSQIGRQNPALRRDYNHIIQEQIENSTCIAEDAPVMEAIFTTCPTMQLSITTRTHPSYM